MPINKRTFIQWTILSILVGSAALLAIVGISLWLVGQTQTYTDAVSAARQIRNATIVLRSGLQDAETGQRGYLLTGKPDYLLPYTNAQNDIPPLLRDLQGLVQDDPQQKTLAARLTEVTTAKLAELKQTVDLAAANQHDAAMAIVLTDSGKQIMDEARTIFDQMLMHAEDQITDSVAHQQSAISSLRAVTLTGAAVIIFVLGSYTVIVLRYTRELTAAERNVQALNAGLEDRVRERTADLNRANEEIQRFAYIVTHDLRAPLVNIMGFTAEFETSLAAVKGYVDGEDDATRAATLADARAATREDLPEAIRFIRSSTRKMDGLINGILHLSREGRRTLNPVSIDLESVIQAQAASVRHQIVEAGGEIAIEGRVPHLVSDRLALEQIFGNLLDNAVKYRAYGRPLRIRVRMHEEHGRVVVDVADNGRGIANQDHERIFDLFRRSGAQDQPGEGIGLAHVRTMVRNLGGAITLASQLDEGTTFTLNFPRDLRRNQQGG